jgi:hypothetical protein
MPDDPKEANLDLSLSQRRIVAFLVPVPARQHEVIDCQSNTTRNARAANNNKYTVFDRHSPNPKLNKEKHAMTKQSGLSTNMFRGMCEPRSGKICIKQEAI